MLYQPLLVCSFYFIKNVHYFGQGKELIIYSNNRHDFTSRIHSSDVLLSYYV